MGACRKTPLKDRMLAGLNARIRKAVEGSSALAGARPVFGSGPSGAPIAVVGEAPGREETAKGMPFVGRAGRYFMPVIEGALGLKREDIYITNAVKVWPALKTGRLKTRKPTKGEEAFFLPYLMEEMEIIGPKVIVAVGKTAFKALLPDEEFRPGVWSGPFGGAMVMPVYHPSYILRRGKDLEKNTNALTQALQMAGRAI